MPTLGLQAILATCLLSISLPCASLSSYSAIFFPIYLVFPFPPIPDSFPCRIPAPLLISQAPLSISLYRRPLTPWSASLLARERFGVTRPRLEPTGLGSWLRSVAPEGVMSPSAITSPTSLGLLQGKGGSCRWLHLSSLAGSVHCVLLPPPSSLALPSNFRPPST